MRTLKTVEATIPLAILDDVKERLTLVGARGMTVEPVKVASYRRRSGAGGARAPSLRAQSAAAEPVPRVQLQVVVTDDMVETVVNAVITVARRGSGHDGEIVVIPTDEVIRIRTAERGEDAL